MSLSLVERAKLVLAKEYREKISDPFKAIDVGEGNCIAGSLILHVLAQADYEDLQIIRHTLALDGDLKGTHFFCVNPLRQEGGRMVHLTNTFKEDHLWTFLQAFSWNVFSAEKALEAFENSSLLQHKQIVTTENRTGGHIATDRFAWIDPGALLEHVAPGQTMAALAEAANAALEAKLNATVV